MAMEGEMAMAAAAAAAGVTTLTKGASSCFAVMRVCMRFHSLLHTYTYLHTEEARKVSDETFRRALLATQDTNVAAPGTTTSEGAVHNVGAKVADNSKVAIVTFLSDAPKEAYHPMQDYKDIYPLTSASLKKYADRWGYKLIIHREPFEEQKQAYWGKMRIIREAFDEGFEWVLYTDIDVLILVGRERQKRLYNSTVDSPRFRPHTHEQMSADSPYAPQTQRSLSGL